MCVFDLWLESSSLKLSECVRIRELLYSNRNISEKGEIRNGGDGSLSLSLSLCLPLLRCGAL